MTEQPPSTSPRAESPSATELQKLTALVQHQLNNPLAALLAETQLLGMEHTLDAQQREAVERITELVRRVIGIVQDLESSVEKRLIRR